MLNNLINISLQNIPMDEVRSMDASCSKCRSFHPDTSSGSRDITVRTES